MKEQTKQERKTTKEAEKQRLEEEEDSKSMTDLDWFLSRSQVCTFSIAQSGILTVSPGLFIRHYGSAQTSSRSQENSNSNST